MRKTYVAVLDVIGEIQRGSEVAVTGRHSSPCPWAPRRDYEQVRVRMAELDPEDTGVTPVDGAVPGNECHRRSVVGHLMLCADSRFVKAANVKQPEGR
jgi:hypothetical protein